MTETLIKAVWDGETNTWSEVELTAEEIAIREELIASSAAAEAERIAAEEALATLKASARAKLIAGEPLTEEEAATLVI
jgi:hypothetical protein